jgi:hypothetical protein
VLSGGGVFASRTRPPLCSRPGSGGQARHGVGATLTLTRNGLALAFDDGRGGCSHPG